MCICICICVIAIFRVQTAESGKWHPRNQSSFRALADCTQTTLPQWILDAAKKVWSYIFTGRTNFFRLFCSTNSHIRFCYWYVCKLRHFLSENFAANYLMYYKFQYAFHLYSDGYLLFLPLDFWDFKPMVDFSHFICCQTAAHFNADCRLLYQRFQLHLQSTQATPTKNLHHQLHH